MNSASQMRPRRPAAWLVRAAGTDPWRALAVEEVLMRQAERFTAALYLWRSRPAVVIGKNQNPWREGHLPTLRQSGVALVRRCSGGGAVYQDPGNLNFAWVARRADMDLDATFGMVLDALLSAGIAAARTVQGSLTVDGLKVSGSAFAYRLGAALHHGTLLVSADLELLRRCLRPTLEDVQSRAVASRPSRVANLDGMTPGLTVERMEEALRHAFARATGGPVLEVDERSLEPPAETVRTLAGWNWTWGQTPPFTWTVRAPLAGGGAHVQLEVEAATVAHARWIGVAPFPGGQEALSSALAGCRFEAGALAARLRALSGAPQVRDNMGRLADQLERAGF